uniref:Uncharacterized protein n=1 Tax=Anopheles epiroticus TaxID=199890 RepID=A0A182PX33_9DIPT
MSSSSTLNRKRSRFLEEAEREFEAEYNRMEASGSFCLTTLTGLNFDVVELGELDNFSAYAFENFLQYLKRCVRKGTKCLEQKIPVVVPVFEIHSTAGSSFIDQYEQGVQAYLSNAWEDCVYLLERALEGYRTYYESVVNCRIE